MNYNANIFLGGRELFSIQFSCSDIEHSCLPGSLDESRENLASVQIELLQLLEWEGLR